VTYLRLSTVPVKRIALWLALLLVISVGGLLIWPRTDPYAPRFRAAATIGHYTDISYSLMPDVGNVEGGKVWMKTRSEKEGERQFVFDLEQQRIAGELLNANPIFLNGDQSRLFCTRPMPPPSNWRQKFESWLGRVSRRKRSMRAAGREETTFWSLDLKNNSAVLLGNANEFPIFMGFVPSPDFRFGLATFNPALSKPGFALCDLSTPSLTHVLRNLGPIGWWDNSTILVMDPSSNLVTYAVPSGTTRLLMTPAVVVAFLKEQNLSEEGQRFPMVWAEWDGRQYRIFLSDGAKRSKRLPSFLVELERPNATLRLLDREFTFESLSHFHSGGRWYVYSPVKRAGQGKDTVILRDLQERSERPLVEGNGLKEWAFPRFYRDTVLYIRSNGLWQIPVTGSNAVRVFPR
jgi:hypothetical protein